MTAKEQIRAPQILIVEDELLVAEDIRLSLTRMGYQVTGTCDSGEKAVVKARELHPDVVLMDIMLKDRMTGIEATRHIHDTSDIPVIFLTAHSDPHTLDQASRTSPYGYLIKPFDEWELRQAIDHVLEQFRG